MREGSSPRLGRHGIEDLLGRDARGLKCFDSLRLSHRPNPRELLAVGPLVGAAHALDPLVNRSAHLPTF